MTSLGADANMSVLPGVCHPHAPKPLATVKRLQVALRDLSRRVSDKKVDPQGADGLVGPHTVKATNYAVPKFTDAPDVLSTGKLTHAQVVAFAPQLAAFVEKAPRVSASAPAPMPVVTPPAVLPSVATPVYTRPSGGTPMPYGPAPAQYYPPGYAPAPHYPGYGPKQASVDIKAFIPAQYEHVKFNPVTVALVIGVGVAAVMVTQKREREK